MKVYYLRFTESDFTQEANVWTTDVVDLYNNDSYSNYSVVKSNYGLDLLGDRTWVGLREISSGVTDSGIIVDDRFVDMTGRIDLSRFSVSFTNLPGDADITPVLSVYTIDDDQAEFPDEWAVKENNIESEGINMLDSYRYVKFALTISTQMDITGLGVELLVRVEIGDPVISPMFDRTRAVLNTFPEWMAVREADNEDSATPISLGGHLVNSLVGEWLDDLDQFLDYLELQHFLVTADENQLAWGYASYGVPGAIWSITGDGVELARTSGAADFYKSELDQDVFYWHEDNNIVLTVKEYDTLLINGIEYEQDPHQIWNWFDEFGLWVDLRRHLLEDNASFKGRILDTYHNKPGVGIEAFKLGLRRELNLWKSFGATPDWEYVGATPEVLEIQDIEADTDSIEPYMLYDGLPTGKFTELALRIAQRYPTTWGYFRWGEASWDPGGPKNAGYSILPYRMDATPVDSQYIQPGVGDGDDLLVMHPTEIGGAQDFTARLIARGRHKVDHDEYPELGLNFYFYGRADRKQYTNPEATEWLTVKVTDLSATPSTDYYHTFQLSAISDVSAANSENSVNSYATYDIWGPDGNFAPDQIWYDEYGDEHDTSSATPFALSALDDYELSVFYGRYDPDLPGLTDFPTEESSKVWFSDDLNTTLTANDTEAELTHTGVGKPFLVFESLLTDYEIVKWTSDKQIINLTLNGAMPDVSAEDAVFDIPEVVWDANLEATPNQEYVVELIDLNEDGDFGVRTTSSDPEAIFLDSDVLYVNGDNVWDEGKIYFDTSETQLIFSSGTTVDYPVNVPIWIPFEAAQTDTYEGIVDENGPWRDGQPPLVGSINYNFVQADVNRNDFGIENTEDYVVTWMGVEILDNTNVIAWLDTNTVKPLQSELGITYPENSIQEDYDENSSIYFYDSFTIRVKLRPGLDSRWYPQVHSGYFYTKDQEYYFYASPQEATATDVTLDLPGVARQGAPIIVWTDEATPQEFREVAFTDLDINADATPTLSLRNTEILKGTGTNKFFLAYENVYDAAIIDTTLGESVAAESNAISNELATDAATDKQHTYEVTYYVNNSFYADHEATDEDGNQITRLYFNKSPSELGVSGFKVHYESALYDTATPVSVPLNSFYTVMDEGFVFIAYDEYTLESVEIRFSPSKILADGEDYMLITLMSLDAYGNPKPGQSFDLATTWGIISPSSAVITDVDGRAVVYLIAEPTTDTLVGTVTVTNGDNLDAGFDFDIDPTQIKGFRLVALPDSDQIPADGQSKMVVYGIVEDDTYLPVSDATVHYRKARSIYELFAKSFDGATTTNSSGRFTLGPFTAAEAATPGYWFVAAETLGTDPTPGVAVGDIVYWYEYPDLQYGVENISGLASRGIQYWSGTTPSPSYSDSVAYPVGTDDATPNTDATPVTINWEPPSWYAIPRYTQYQLGFMGSGFYDVQFDDLQNMHPDSKDM